MMEFFSQYPFLKWTLVGFGILALLSKYLKFDPIDKLIDRVKRRYKFEEINHLNDPKLKQSIELLTQQNFEQLTQMFGTFNSSYRSFGFKALGQYGDLNTINSWIEQDPNNDLPKIIKAYHLVHKGWEVRGRGKIDTVSAKNLKAFKDQLQQAKGLLLAISGTSPFLVNVHAMLLKIYKAIDVDRQTIHNTFLAVEPENRNDAELNFNYFAAISPKWGGNQEELNGYLDTMESRSEFINNLILTQYYFDFVHMSDGKDKNLEMKKFIEQMKSYNPEEGELYKYELYLLLYWLSNNLEYDALEKHYKQLVTNYVRD